ncbi:MAG: DUF4954 family protein [Clostridium sp.]|nr:DUF4954 family protein [Clostridium sp.]
MNYRTLNQQDITQLESQSCSATDWSRVTVHPDINLKYIRHTRFSGDIRLGRFEKTFHMAGGMMKHAGLFQATLHNVTVGDDCCIENIKNYIANYDIEDNCFIENVDIILTDGRTAFGNGTEVAVLNETGGREVTIHDRLSAHEAYIEAMYRHRPVVVEHLKAMATAYAEERSSRRGTIGSHSTIVDAGYIKNVRVGTYAEIEGAGRLKNGTVNSRREAPVRIGYGVVCDDFIIQDGSTVTDCTMLSRCYVGQACTLGHGYSASDSLFFCNCHEENGEACAIFAGPFTVTHHKSSLLIAGMFSFMNAGSGSNQSNHMYKLGPIHQGAMERGAKTSSNSYILWPARIGAFSLVMGRHTSNPDTSALPFSYLIEQKGTTYLAPGVNLRSVGTIRDVQKWPKRDKRKADLRMDCVNFNLLSPYTVAKMLRGIHVLEELQQLSGETSDTYAYRSARIKNSALRKGLHLYRLAVNKFLGNSLISRLEQLDNLSADELATRLAPTDSMGEGEWVDLSGLIAPKSCVTALLERIERDEFHSIDELNAYLQQVHANYYDYEWTWAYHAMLNFYRLSPDHLTPDRLADIIRCWRDAVVELDKMLYEDARKEFSLSARTGFGFDGTTSTAAADFEQVRGDFESNPFVTTVTEHIRVKSELADRWLKRMEELTR